MENWWDQAERHDGLLTVGRPYCAESDEMDFEFGGAHQVFPVGETSFMTAFANRCQDKTMEALEPIEMLLTTAQVGQLARQAANVVLHHCVAAKGARLLRRLLPEVTTRVAEANDKRVMRSFAKINDFEEEETNQHDAQVALPTTQGGVALRSSRGWWTQHAWRAGCNVRAKWLNSWEPCRHT